MIFGLCHSLSTFVATDCISFLFPRAWFLFFYLRFFSAGIFFFFFFFFFFPLGGGFGAARRTDENHEFSVMDFQALVADRVKAVGVNFVHLLEHDLGHGSSLSSCRLLI
eukprot:TRINITY_DN35965_c0_g1_i1.p1 TRINITY_DN35965_c0_g1~~TRINITY_DN35965_c0_g1_i1.p1  ORF type:complete len:109 (-),score=7.23 TRINITY_DN35965_c0_g1_i1:197-523(-)